MTDDIKFFFVNYTRRTFDRICERRNAIKYLSYITTTAGYHFDGPWALEEMIDLVTEEEKKEIEKKWEENDVDYFIKIVRRHSEPDFCCHADGYVGGCCPEQAFRDKLEKFIQESKRWHWEQLEYLQGGGGFIFAPRDELERGMKEINTLSENYWKPYETALKRLDQDCPCEIEKAYEEYLETLPPDV